jgi:hypothetical protein
VFRPLLRRLQGQLRSHLRHWSGRADRQPVPARLPGEQEGRPFQAARTPAPAGGHGLSGHAAAFLPRAFCRSAASWPACPCAGVPPADLPVPLYAPHLILCRCCAHSDGSLPPDPWRRGVQSLRPQPLCGHHRLSFKKTGLTRLTAHGGVCPTKTDYRSPI